MKNRCEGCVHAAWNRAEGGEFDRYGYGQCTFKYTPLPNSMDYAFKPLGTVAVINRNRQWAKDCPHWKSAVEAALPAVVAGMAGAFYTELYGRSQEQLEEYLWHFKFDASKSAAANIYNFTEMLGLYGKLVRRWEEHHNGSCCVVERVRDKYLMPKIERFAADMRATYGAEGVA